MFIQEKATLRILIEKKKDIWGGQRTLQFKMMKCYSLHTKIKNEMKLKKWNGYQSNAGQGIKGEGSHTIKKKSKRASASRSLQNKGASVSKTRTFYGSTSKLLHSTPSPQQHTQLLSCAGGYCPSFSHWPSCSHTGQLLFQTLWLVIINLPADRLLKVFPLPCWSIGFLFHKLFSALRVQGCTAQASPAGPALALTPTCAEEALLMSEHSWLSTQLLDCCFSEKAWHAFSTVFFIHCNCGNLVIIDTHTHTESLTL